MGVHIEAQDHNEVMQIRSRELQMENTQKLNEIIPVVQSIDEVNLPQMENHTKEIKDMIVNNIDNQIDLDDINDNINRLSKQITEVKKSQTRLNNSFKALSDKIDEAIKQFGDLND